MRTLALGPDGRVGERVAMAMGTDRRWAISGIAFFIFYVGGFLILGAGAPSQTAKIEKVMSFYHDNKGRNFGAVEFAVLGAISLVFFVGYLRSVLARDAGVGDVLPPVVIGGGVITAVGMLVMGMTHIALLNAVSNHQPDVAHVLNSFDNNSFLVIVGGFAVLFLGTGIALLRGALLPKWLGWVSIALGVITLAGPLGMIAFFLAPLWVLAMAVVLLREGDRTLAHA